MNPILKTQTAGDARRGSTRAENGTPFEDQGRTERTGPEGVLRVGYVSI